MNKALLIFTITSLLMGCNINPSKEARLQKLETEIEANNKIFIKFESRIKALEIQNEQLQTRVQNLEQQ